jgi:hypothetical protein
MADLTLDPKRDPRDSDDSPQDNAPSTVATPEGDNEFAPDQPLAPLEDSDETVQKWPTTPPAEEHHEPSGLEKFIDDISHGKLVP